MVEGGGWRRRRPRQHRGPVRPSDLDFFSGGGQTPASADGRRRESGFRDVPAVTSRWIFSSYEVGGRGVSERVTRRAKKKKKNVGKHLRFQTCRRPACARQRGCHLVCVMGSGCDDGARLSSVAMLNRAGVTFMNRADVYGTAEALFKFLSQKEAKQLLFLRNSSLTTWHRFDELISYIYCTLRGKCGPRAHLKPRSFLSQHGPRSRVIGSQSDLKL